MKKMIQKKKILFITLPVILIAAVVFVFVFMDRTPETNKPVQNNAQAVNDQLPVINEKETQNQPTQKNTNNTPTPKNNERPTVSPLNKEISQGNIQSKKIAITLDAGASATQTPEILSILEANNVHCTFFVTGRWAEQNPNLIKQMVAEGHTLGNHTYSHTDLTTLTDSQILEEFKRTENIIKSIVPSTTTKPYFRAPFGDRNQHVLDVAASAGYQSIYWTFDALDWKPESTAYQVKQRIFDNIKNGAIVLMHVGDDITPSILQEVITNLEKDGYQLGTMEQLLK